MMRKGFDPRKLLLGAALLATCASLVASSSRRERRHVGVEESSHGPGWPHTPPSRNFKSSTSRNNEITTEPGRKVSHRLIGGHLRANSKQQPYEELWDDGIVLSSAGNGRESKPNRKDEDDEKKTLSQQVKEGKYGLIQNEIYPNRPKRPGIISYTSNPEVPKDTADNLGGLDEDEIWLAENHVLVLRGGKFPGHETTQGSGDSETTWPPIDNYKAPRRQVKIPSRPKVPPPFPVQLTEGGPIQIIGPNGTKEIGNGTVDYRKDPLLTKGLLSEDGPLFAIISNGTFVMPNEDSGNITSKDKGTKSDPLPGSLPPFYHAIPPGAVFLPPPSNQSDYDEEDQSIYYPPPYSFQYPQDNSTAVPPGPLVPGIILPPPPDFFSPLEDKKTTAKKYSSRPGTTPLPRPRPTYLPPRKLATKRYKSTTTVPITKSRTSSVIASNNTKMYRRTTLKNATSTFVPSNVKTVPYTQVTTPVPDKTTTLDNPEFYSLGPIVGNRVNNQENVQEKNQVWSGLVTSKTIPIVSYYASSTQSTLEKPVEVTPASIRSIVTTGNPERSPSQASYYFYEESNGESTITTADPSIYYKTTTETPFYETVTQPRPVDKKKQYYSVEAVPSQETSKDYSVKYVDSVVKNSEPVRYSDSTVTRSSSRYESGSSRAQGQRMLPDRAPLYYQTISGRPAQQPYYTTPRPQTYYRQDKPKPIYQYSFEAADYSKRGNQRQQFEQQQQQNLPYNSYPDVKIPSFNDHRFDYDQTESTQKRQRPESLPYKIQQPVYPSTTSNSVVNTTPNPHLSYYTHQDEKLLDDVTKEYFTIFGKKLPHKTVPSTTPIYSKSTTERPDYNTNRYIENNYNTAEAPVFKTPNVKVHYGDQSQRPYSLKDDILVNYRQPLPPIDPDSEFITLGNPNRQQPPNYRISDRNGEPLAPLRAYAAQPLVSPANGPSTNYVPIADSPEEIDESYPQLPISLEDDIKVNYRDPRPTIDPDAEFIDPLPVPEENQPGKPKAYFAYRLPGDGGHFYFLTPQAVAQRPERNTGHLYSKSRGTRLLRRRRRPGNV
ncbi:uncharacterized protein LOC143345508 [Colletes latitarsis]|uniref:uncharacterized protein LOC143345508 n=1 Tax=Colletes latitarsis TaxID=2605962 RepID=UPI0040359EAD